MMPEVEASKEGLGPRHPDTLRAVSNLASLLQAKGLLDEARPLYEEALQAQRETLGDRDPSTLISIRNMGGLLQAMGKLDEASVDQCIAHVAQEVERENEKAASADQADKKLLSPHQVRKIPATLKSISEKFT